VVADTVVALLPDWNNREPMIVAVVDRHCYCGNYCWGVAPVASSHFAAEVDNTVVVAVAEEVGNKVVDFHCHQYGSRVVMMAGTGVDYYYKAVVVAHYYYCGCGGASSSEKSVAAEEDHIRCCSNGDYRKAAVHGCHP
jgi:hypothetical protein